MKTLGIDTSSLACSCALIEDGVLLSECFLHTGLTHSRTLTGLLRRTLAQADTAPCEIGRIAVCAGPGSYTGLRIGVSAAKGFAAAYHTPCVGVSTLLSLAQNVVCREGVVCAALDARVGQVYAALFEIKGGVITRLTQDDAITLDALGELLPPGALVVGDGTLLVTRRFADKGLFPAPAALRYQRASSAALLAEGMEAQDASLLIPDYHRKPQAEREREARLQQEQKERSL